MPRKRKKVAPPKRELEYEGADPPGSRHVKLTEIMQQSPAWRHLSLAGRCLLIELLRIHNGYNNGQLDLSVRDAADRLNIGKNKAQATFKELLALGFIRVTRIGAFSMKQSHATAYALTCYGLPGGAPGAWYPTKEYMSWRPPEKQNTVPEGGTACPQERDPERKAVPKKGTDGPQVRDREHPKSGVHGPQERDIHIPVYQGGVPEQVPAPQQKPARRKRPDRPDPGVIDLEELLGGPPARPSPQEQLRDDVQRYLDTVKPPRGKAGLARQVGLSRPRLSNWLAGRDPVLSRPVEIALRHVVASPD